MGGVDASSTSGSLSRAAGEVVPGGQLRTSDRSDIVPDGSIWLRNGSEERSAPRNAPPTLNRICTHRSRWARGCASWAHATRFHLALGMALASDWRHPVHPRSTGTLLAMARLPSLSAAEFFCAEMFTGFWRLAAYEHRICGVEEERSWVSGNGEGFSASGLSPGEVREHEGVFGARKFFAWEILAAASAGIAVKVVPAEDTMRTFFERWFGAGASGPSPLRAWAEACLPTVRDLVSHFRPRLILSELFTMPLARLTKEACGLRWCYVNPGYYFGTDSRRPFETDYIGPPGIINQGELTHAAGEADLVLHGTDPFFDPPPPSITTMLDPCGGNGPTRCRRTSMSQGLRGCLSPSAPLPSQGK
jgi:hypothetical protein